VAWHPRHAVSCVWFRSNDLRYTEPLTIFLQIIYSSSLHSCHVRILKFTLAWYSMQLQRGAFSDRFPRLHRGRVPSATPAGPVRSVYWLHHRVTGKQLVLILSVAAWFVRLGSPQRRSLVRRICSAVCKSRLRLCCKASLISIDRATSHIVSLPRLESFRQFVAPFKAYCCHMGTAIKHPVRDRVKPSFVIFDIRALWRSARSRTGCFMAVPIWQQ